MLDGMPWIETYRGTVHRWEADNVEHFTVAYYFARDLQKALGVPVGIIHTSWGGSPAEVWMSEQVLAANPTREFDERWGKGFVTPQVFIQRVFIERERARKKG